MTSTRQRLVPTKALRLALSVLDLPKGPTFKELRQQAKDYVKSLSKEDYEQLKQEALEESSSFKDDYVDKLELFSQMLFSPIEARAYAGMRIDSPGVRRVIARRALLGIIRGWDKLPAGMIHPDICIMEDTLLTHDDGSPYTEDEVMQKLLAYRKKMGI